jgi:hypothetical protein
MPVIQVFVGLRQQTCKSEVSLGNIGICCLKETNKQANQKKKAKKRKEKKSKRKKRG